MLIHVLGHQASARCWYMSWGSRHPQDVDTFPGAAGIRKMLIHVLGQKASARCWYMSAKSGDSFYFKLLHMRTSDMQDVFTLTVHWTSVGVVSACWSLWIAMRTVCVAPSGVVRTGLGVASRLGWTVRGTIHSRGKRFFCPFRLDRPCGPLSLLFNGYQGCPLWRYSGRSLKLPYCLGLEWVELRICAP